MSEPKGVWSTGNPLQLDTQEKPLTKEEILRQLEKLTGSPDPEDSRLQLVELDGLVVLKIIKHCKENQPEVVGQLLGLNFGATLQITNSFPFPTRTTEGAGEEEEADYEASAESYQVEMKKRLRDVNIDNNTVGWYQANYLETFLTPSMIDTQFNYQTIIPKCVMVIYDSVRSKQGSLYLKAFRLTDPFMELFKNQTFTQEALNKSGLPYQEILEEIPVVIKNSPLSNALLYDLEETHQVDIDFDRFSLNLSPFLEKNLEKLTEHLHELTAEQTSYQWWQRNYHRQEAQKSAYLKNRKDGRHADDEEDINQVFKPLTQPNRLQTLLLTNRLNNYCENITQFAGHSFSKLYMVQGLHKKPSSYKSIK